MAVGFKINVYGATNFRDSTNKLIDGIDKNSIKLAEQISNGYKDTLLRNFRVMVPHKNSTIRRLNSGELPLSKRVQLLRTKTRQYSVMVPQPMIYLDEGTRIRVVRPTNKRYMRWINGKNMEYVFRKEPMIINGNPAYGFISMTNHELPNIVSKFTDELLKKNKKFYN